MLLQQITAALFAIIVGAAFIFWGYRIFLVLLPIWGFFAGLWFGAQAMSLIFGGGFLATTSGLVVGLILGLILAVLSYLFYFIGIAIVAAIIGYGLGAGLMTGLGLSSGFLSALVGIIVGVVIVVLVLRFNLQKYVVIFLTAIGGANALVLGFLLAFNRVDLAGILSAGDAIQPVMAVSLGWKIVWIALAIIGIVMQIRTNRTYEFDDTRYVETWG